ncbi:MAG: hypothetical protein MZW92_38230 [Comamonadaceae bacterium]|nr:hypothetical protein [Comamonadaceae bacterium]
MNWQSFAELAFSFTLTPEIVAKSLGFSLVNGTGRRRPCPAARAARMNIRQRPARRLRLRMPCADTPAAAVIRWRGIMTSTPGGKPNSIQ